MKKEAVIRKAVIPAAGLGTRFLPAAKAMPKEMFPIVDKPAIQYIIEEAVASGIDDILIITGRGKRAIEDHFDKCFELNQTLKEKQRNELLSEIEKVDNMVDIHYIRQKEALGLGHAILCAKKHVGKEPFAVLLGDDMVLSEKPCLSYLIELFERNNASVVAVAEIPKEEVYKYGVIKYKKVGSDLFVEDLIEKPTVKDAPSNLAILGRYILKPEIFEILEKMPFGVGKELQLTDGLRILNQRDKMMAYNIKGKWLTVGDKLTYLKATVEYALQRKDLGKDFLEYLKEVVKQER